MKEYKLGYIGSSYVIEVIARTKEEKIRSFLKLIDLVDFENSTNVITSEQTDKNLNVLNNSFDIREEFRRIFKSKTIDLTKFRYLIQSGSDLCNLKLFKIIEKFFELFEYELYFSYENAEFDMISRMIHLVGIVEDKEHYIELGNTLVGNTIVMQFVNKQDLINKLEIESKNQKYKLIDKI